MKTLTQLLFALLLLAPVALMAGGDKGHSERDAAPQISFDERLKACAVCHGEGGNSSNPAFPKLAGQHKSYLVYAMKAYRSGERQNAIMAGQAAALSDREIKALARYYAKAQGDLYTKGE